MKRYLKTVLLLLSIQLFNTQLYGSIQGENLPDSIKVKIDKLFENLEKENSPGAAIAVIKDRKVIFKKGYGYANLEFDIKVSPKTIFHVASVSKQFTAFAVALLAEQGKLSLDEDIREYLKEIPDFGKLITVKDLIYHISGIRDQWELLAMAGWRLDDVITKEHILKMVKHQKELNFEPGEEFLYCNTGYTLLAEIVSRISGKSFPEFCRENIFSPLGMVNTHFHDDHEKIVKNRAYSYYSENNNFKKSVLSYANAGATSLFTTVEDLAKWMINFETRKAGGSYVFEQMHEQGILNNGRKISYAFGLFIGEYRGLKTVGHGGADAGFRSHVLRFPDQNFSVVILSNFSSFSSSMYAYRIADIFLKDRLKPEKKEVERIERHEIKINPVIFEKYEGDFQLPPRYKITITNKDGRLMLRFPGQSKVQMYPEAENKFFLKNMDVQITFIKDDNGNFNDITLHRGARDYQGKRVEKTILTARQLAEYEGDYYSEELGTFYTITAGDNQLTAEHRRHDNITLDPDTKDTFLGNRWFFGRVSFIRDRNGEITGFLLSGGRVRNMRFLKHNFQ